MWRSRLISATKSLRLTAARSNLGQKSIPTIFPKVICSKPILGSSKFVQNLRLFSSDSVNPTVNVNVGRKLNPGIPIFDSDVVAHRVFDESPGLELPEPWMEDPDEFASYGVDIKNYDLGPENVGSVAENEGVNNLNVREGVGSIDPKQLEMVLSLLRTEKGNVHDHGYLDSDLDSMGLELSEEFVIRVIETPHVPINSLLEFVAWAKSRSSGKSLRSFDALFCMICAAAKSKEQAYYLWNRAQVEGKRKDGFVTTGMLNEIIHLFSRLGEGMTCYEVFSEFECFSCVPNPDSYYLTIEGLWSVLCDAKVISDKIVEENGSSSTILNSLKLVCDKMKKEGKFLEPEKVGKIVNYLCKAGMIEDAYSVYDSARRSKIVPPLSYVFFLISSVCRGKEKDVYLVLEAMSIVKELLKSPYGEDRKNLIKPITWVFRGLCLNDAFIEAENLLSEMIEDGPFPGNAVFNDLIGGLSRVGNLQEAKKIMRIMESKGLKPDVFTYSVIISGYVRAGKMQEAEKVIHEVKKTDHKLTLVTCQTLLRGYCNALKFDKTFSLLEELEEYGAELTADEYNKMIQSVCGTAEKMTAEANEKGFQLDEKTKGIVKSVKELVEESVEPGEVSVAA